MDPERWHQLNQLFHAALEHDPTRRATFLDEACAGDPSLQAEVASLLAHHEQASGFIDTPAPAAAAERPEVGSGESLVGQRLGQYVVIRKLGQGGMGVVYLADDTRLRRPVAIKALAREFTGDDQRRDRLRREAQAAAALSHPGIATVYALEEFDDNLYIVCEYVPGETLRAEVDNGPLPLGPLLNAAVGIAGALVAAHEHGVIHRDLKPENVIRTEDGGIKVLDFGLARFQSTQRQAAPSSTRLTEPGTILGTPGYIAPEQLRGSNVDFRADIFSFGVMLYELAAGVHPFEGSGPASTIARILETEPPDITQLRPLCPPGLDRVIRNCLAKDREQRPSTTRELAQALEQVRRDVAESETRRPASREPVRVEDTQPASGLSPLWWWQFHEVLVGCLYWVALYPVWKVREWTPGIWGSVLFFSTLIAVGVAELRLVDWLRLRLDGGLDDYTQKAGLGPTPSIEARFTPATAPLLGESRLYLRGELSATVYWLDAPGYSRRGGLYRVAYEHFNPLGREGGTFGFVRTEIVQHIPILRETWVVSLRARAESIVRESDVVPFFLMPRLGGGTTLRAYTTGRFRDRHAMLVTGEFRWVPNRLGLDIALFYDAGKVAPRYRGLTLDDMKTDYGIGVRFHSLTMTALRLEVAHGDDGWRGVLTTHAPF